MNAKLKSNWLYQGLQNVENLANLPLWEVDALGLSERKRSSDLTQRPVKRAVKKKAS